MIGSQPCGIFFLVGAGVCVCVCVCVKEDAFPDISLRLQLLSKEQQQ